MQTAPNGWQKGLMISIRKSGDGELIDTYRHITLVPSMYKIRATIISNRISPILSILTNGRK